MPGWGQNFYLAWTEFQFLKPTLNCSCNRIVVVTGLCWLNTKLNSIAIGTAIVPDSRSMISNTFTASHDPDGKKK